MTKPKLGDYRVVEKWRRGKDEKPEKYYVVEEYQDVVVQKERKRRKEVCFEIDKSFLGIKYKTWDKEYRDVVVDEEIREDKWEVVQSEQSIGKLGTYDVIYTLDDEFETRIKACNYIKKLKQLAKNKAIPLPEDKVVTCK